MGKITTIKPNPTNVTSPSNNIVSQFPLSFIKGHIETKVFISEGNPIIITIIAPVSTWPSSAATDFAQSYILEIKPSKTSSIGKLDFDTV